MKSCDVCGTFNLKENIYCTHCGSKILAENICPFCGQKNPDSNEYCLNCNKQITPIAIDSFDVLFSEYNRKLIFNAEISFEIYFNILERIFKKLDYSKITGKTPKEMILQIANVFTLVLPKSSGVVHGEIGNSVIYYDDRLDDSSQISAIIHELAHFLLFDISVNLLCEILNVKASDTIKSFIDSFLINPKMELMNEYCAHTVENRFIPLKFQSFASFERCALNFGNEFAYMTDYVKMGNTFAKHIIIYLEKYIDEKLRKLIKLQFKNDEKIANEVNPWDIDEYFSPEENTQMFIFLMAGYFDELHNNKEARAELEYIKLNFESIKYIRI